MSKTSKTLEFSDNHQAVLLFGMNDENLMHLEKELGISIAHRGNHLNLSGEDEAIAKAANVLNTLWEDLNDDEAVKPSDIDSTLRFLNEKNGHKQMNAPKGKINIKY